MEDAKGEEAKQEYIEKAKSFLTSLKTQAEDEEGSDTEDVQEYSEEL